MIPAKLPTPKIRIIIVNGWMFNFELIIRGEIILLSNCCTIVTIIITYKACIGDTNSPTITAGVAPINGPKLGMMFVNAAIIPKTKAYGKSIIK